MDLPKKKLRNMTGRNTMWGVCVSKRMCFFSINFPKIRVYPPPIFSELKTIDFPRLSVASLM